MEFVDAAGQGFEPRIGRSVSLDEAARLMRVSRRTIYNRIRDGRLQTIRTIGGSQRVVISSMLADVVPGTSSPGERSFACQDADEARQLIARRSAARKHLSSISSCATPVAQGPELDVVHIS